VLLHPLLATGGWAWPTDLQPLLAALRRHRFSVQLGIGRQTLLHEAAHAVQSCPHGQLRPVGWRLPLATVVRQEIEGITFTAYGHGSREVEREAFALQAQPDAVTLLLKGLAQRCKRKPS